MARTSGFMWSGAGDLVLKRVHPRRGREAINAHDIIPRYGGVIVHDCWASYFSFEHATNALCGGHLLRELVFVEESNGYTWAGNIKRLLQETCHTVSGRETKCLSEEEYARLQRKRTIRHRLLNG